MIENFGQFPLNIILIEKSLQLNEFSAFINIYN